MEPVRHPAKGDAILIIIITITKITTTITNVIITHYLRTTARLSL